METWQRTALEGIPREDGRPKQAEPFTCLGWTCASQGTVLLAVEGEHGYRPWESAAHVVEPYIVDPAPPVQSFTARVEDVREWAGDPEPPCPDCTEEDREKICEECKGEGEVDCECFDCGDYHFAECPECKGDGGHFCRTCQNTGIIGLYHHEGRIARLGGRDFSKAMWAWLLKDLPAGPMTIGLPEVEWRPALIQGDGWRGCVMPLRDDAARLTEPFPAEPNADEEPMPA